MSEALVPAAAETAVGADGEADVVLPALIVNAGPDAVQRFFEFFAGRIANARTRAATGGPWGSFSRGARREAPREGRETARRGPRGRGARGRAGGAVSERWTGRGIG